MSCLVKMLTFALVCILLSGCLVRKGELGRIEDLVPSRVGTVEALTLTFGHTIDDDGTIIILSEKLAAPLREKTKEHLETLAAVKVSLPLSDFKLSDYKLSATFKERRNHNFLWALIASTSLFIVPYHGSNDYEIDAVLTWKDKTVQSYRIVDSADVWAHVLLAPVGLFRWPRSVQNIQDNMLKNLAIKVTQDVQAFDAK
jgi:hypothetical protein